MVVHGALILLGLGLGFSVNDRDVRDRYSENDTLWWSDTRTRSRNSQSIAFETIVTRYINPDSHVNAFWGIGPFVSFYRQKMKEGNEYVSADNYGYYSYLYSQCWTVGLRAVIGAEWFATGRISFHAEYQADLRYEWGYTERIYKRYDSPADNVDAYEKDSSNTWSLYSGNVVFGMSLYF